MFNANFFFHFSHTVYIIAMPLFPVFLKHTDFYKAPPSEKPRVIKCVRLEAAQHRTIGV